MLLEPQPEIFQRLVLSDDLALLDHFGHLGGDQKREGAAGRSLYVFLLAEVVYLEGDGVITPDFRHAERGVDGELPERLAA